MESIKAKVQNLTQIVNLDHRTLENLDYENSGHIGFASAQDLIELENKIEEKQDKGDYATQQDLYALSNSIPTKTSELQNDSGFLTEIIANSIDKTKLSTDIQEDLNKIDTIKETINNKQEKLTAGSGIEISEDNVISATNSTEIEFATSDDIANLFVTDELLGTWLFNESTGLAKNLQYNLSFMSNNQSYSYMRGYTSDSWVPEEFVYYDETKVFDGRSNFWSDEAYRTITITDTSALTNREEFTTWLKANAVKQ